MNVPALNRIDGERARRDIFAPDFREEPYWWTAAMPEDTDGAASGYLPAKADVVVVGAGITGIVAAIHLARSGLDVVVLDSQRIGEGAARRNAGFIGRTLKRSVGWLTKRSGREHALGVYRELDRALKGVESFVREEQIECFHRTCGRFIGANSEAHLRGLVDDLEDMRQALGFEYQMVQPKDVRSEIASDRYHGGAVIPDLGSIHPGLYHKGLVDRAKTAGVRFYGRTTVNAIERQGDKHSVRTSAGDIVAGHVVITTNGYTSADLKWYARRVIPFSGFILATEVLPEDLIERVLPKRRTYLDTKVNIDFIRPAPDSSRILFGGMTGTKSTSALPLAAPLHERLVGILPDLKGVRLSRAWTGFCAGTFDFMPHIGREANVHFALGYNFAGIPIGTHFGMLLANRILERGDTRSVFDTDRFPTFPFYRGNPWFVPMAMRYFDWHDRRIARE
ncbi:FAD-binding oxidoreductase [Rhizobium sp. TRM95111]|uniref:NAD(P)/FAD-dependent oxidoreductase n=1 Tax=Rhizobium alarense TaxID=2846851 RepID=UPI001F1AACED|nr:FAD-binding oxidoreductase [Rhizobium alarense]MCF3641988.1 FAD-binding oxidoreductase [Rhizobium alarense]